MQEANNLNKTSWFVNPWFDTILLAGFPTTFIISFLVYSLYINLPGLLTNGYLYTAFNFPHAITGLTAIYLYRQEIKEKRFQFIWIPLIFISTIIILVLSNYRHLWIFRLFWGSLHMLIQNYYILGLYKLRAKDYLKLDKIIDNTFLVTVHSDYPIQKLPFVLKNYIGQTTPLIDTLTAIRKPFLINYWYPLVGFIVIAFILRQAYLLFRYKKAYPFKIFMFSAIFSSYYYLLIITRELYVAYVSLIYLHCIQWIFLVWFYHRLRFKEGIIKGARFISYIFQSGRAGLYFLFLILITIVFNSMTFRMPVASRISLIQDPITIFHFFIEAIIWKASRMRRIISESM